ncbi:MAG: OmpA family protein [Paludibacteraceae bacterium]
MNTRLFSILLCVLMSFGSAFAAPKASAHKKITKSYVNVQLTEVLDDIGRRSGYTVDYTDANIDFERMVTIKFKDVSATSAIKKLLGKKFIVKAKKNDIKITNPPAPPTIYKSPGVEPANTTEDDDKIVKTYQDTTFSVTCHTQTRRLDSVVVVESAPTRKGHYVQALLGLGYGSMGYSLRDAAGEKVGKNLGDLQGLLQAQYAYYFNENWGITVGVGFAGYGSYGVLNNTNVWEGQGDTDGEQYTHYAVTHDWREQQITHIVELPVGVQCQYPITKDNLRLYAGVGVRVGMPVYNKWALKSGSLEHQGYYPQWEMTIVNQPDRDFYTEEIGIAFSKERHNLNLTQVALTASAEVGVMYPLNERLDLMAGLYFQMNCLDLNNESQQAIGWKQPSADDYRRHDFMNMYNGELASDFVSGVRPWGVGVKVGISWHHVEKKTETRSLFEHVVVCDTTMKLTARTETEIKPKKEAAKEIVRLMKKSVIWFDLNSTVPKLEPADIIDQIAAVLLENPDQKIIVSGHASKEGNARKNRILSEKRAQAVADLLLHKGVKAEQLRVEAHAADIAYDAGSGVEHSIALDRRVEIIPIEE